MSDPIKDIENLPRDPMRSVMDLAVPGGVGGQVWDLEKQGGLAVENWWNKTLGADAAYSWIKAGERSPRAQEPGADLPSARGVAAPGAQPMTPEQREQADRGSAEVASQFTNPLNYPIDPASAIGLAGHAPQIASGLEFVGAPAFHALASGDMGALLWTGITGGLMGLGHMGPAADALRAAIPGLGKGVNMALSLNEVARKIAEDPFHKDLVDNLGKALDSANEELSKRPALVKRSDSAAVKDPKTGEIKLSSSAAREKTLKHFNVKDEAGLVRYIQARGGLSPEDSAYLEKNYKNLLFTNPLFSEDLPAGEFIDPRQHLGPLKQQDPQAHGRAIQATTAFHILYEMAERGPHSARNPAVAILRGAVYWNQSLDLFEKKFVDSLKAVVPGIDDAKLVPILERGALARDEYDALSPAEKFVADMYRLYSHTTNVFERKAGLRKGTIGNYVPRIAESLGLKRGSGGSKGAGVLVQDNGKSRLWRTVAQPSITHVDPGDLEPIRRQLGNLGTQLSDEELAAVHQIAQKLNAEDTSAVVQSLRDARSPQAASKIIQTWVDNIQEKSPDVTLRMVPAFDSVAALNEHYAQRRADFPTILFQTPSDATRLAKEAGTTINVKHPEIARIIREKDEQAAKDLAMRIFTPRRTGLFSIMESGHFARQLKAAHAAETVKQLGQSVVEFKDAATGKKINGFAAVKRATDPRANQLDLDRGYRQVAEQTLGPYQNYLFAPPVADFIDRASRLRDLGFVEKLAQLEQKAIGLIMYNPLFHGWNIAGRMMAYGMTHPFMMVHWLKNDRHLMTASPEERERGIEALRMEAHMNGVITPHSAQHAAGDMSKTMSNALADASLHDLMLEREGPVSRALERVPGYGKVKSFNEGMQRVLWNSISDFGVAVYHMEREAAVRSGVDEDNASRWAGRRANTWMGHVSELDHNPTLHKISRLLMFAPNYWRTFGEQLLPIYMNSGIEWTPEMTGYVARQQVATVMSLLAMQKLTGESMNWITSGHWQNENQAGNQDRIEVSRPELIRALQAVNWPGAANIDPDTGMDPKTGGRLVMENPLARQERAGEEMLGLQSGHADWQPMDALSGTVKVAAARMSPLLQSAATLANVDVYNSISSGTLRNVNPDHNNPDLWNVALAGLALTPLGMGVQSASREFRPQNSPFQEQSGPFGTTVPKWVSDAVSQGPPSLAMSVLSALTGVSSPYESSPKSRGEQPSDQDYRKLAQVDQTYQNDLLGLSAKALSGQMTPGQWRDAYHQLSTKHQGAVSALMRGAPDYTQGTKGMVAQWERLYQDATDPTTGELDPDVLAQKQAEFKANYSQAEIDAMNAELNKNAQKDPMLQLYRQSLDSYYSWQAQWAASNGFTVQQIQDESRQYYALKSTDPTAASLYQSEHPELGWYQQDKDQQFYTTTQGMLYGLFVNSSVVSNYLQQTYTTPQELLGVGQ